VINGVYLLVWWRRFGMQIYIKKGIATGMLMDLVWRHLEKVNN
tara:strand:+ start:442 stop:570 length:129 start_codon:yes stop_codon:yes gene_type:complete